MDTERYVKRSSCPPWTPKGKLRDPRAHHGHRTVCSALELCTAKGIGANVRCSICVWFTHVTTCIFLCFSETILTCICSCVHRITYLMDLFVRYEEPILFVGPTGTGKSAYVQQKLMHGLSKDKYMPTFVNFSAQTSANQTQVRIEPALIGCWYCHVFKHHGCFMSACFVSWFIIMCWVLYNSSSYVEFCVVHHHVLSLRSSSSCAVFCVVHHHVLSFV